MRLADEPSGALDSINAGEVMRLLHEACQRGVAAVVVTHDAQLAAWADRVVLLRDGRLTDPAQDSAAYYLTQLRASDPGNPGVTSASGELAGKLLERARAAGIPVLGAYHYLWPDPPNNIEDQVNFWMDCVDAQTPWWKFGQRS